MAVAALRREDRAAVLGSFRDSVVAALAYFVASIVLMTLWVTFVAVP